jgi:predicted lactoylglutathione lyase
MIGYVTLGTNDLQRGARFYDELLAGLGAKRAMQMEHLIAWAAAPNAPMLALIRPFDGKPATAGNGVMVAIAAGSRANVDQLHAKAIALGARDEGAPGPRGEGGFYGGYFRDPDGNKLAFFHMG